VGLLSLFFFSVFSFLFWNVRKAVLKNLSSTMTTLKIKTHRPKNSYSGNYFFILSKGLNAGKPLDKPCPNCFVLFAKSDEEKNRLYWLCFGLWQGNFFQPFLTGSVIPFIRLEVLKQVIAVALTKLNANEFEKAISIMRDLQKHQENISKQLVLIRQAKKALMHGMLK
jgi:hypothetical protein